MKAAEFLFILFVGIIISCKEIDRSRSKGTISIKMNNLNYNANCGCISDSLITENTASCDTTVLSNKSRLYYQFNCDSIWLTLEDLKRNRNIIYSEATNFKDLYGYQFRLGYQLSKEYDKLLLFRSGCPANGPCNFILVDKITGKLKKELGELIYNHEEEHFYDFVLYFSKKNNSIIADFIDKEKQIEIPIIESHFKVSLIPEYQFDEITYTNKIISLTYNYNQGEAVKTNTITVDTKKYIR